MDLPFLNTSPSPEGTDGGDDATLNDLLALYQSANDVPPPFAPMAESEPTAQAPAPDFSDLPPFAAPAPKSPDAEIDDLIKSFQDASAPSIEPPPFAAPAAPEPPFMAPEPPPFMAAPTAPDAPPPPFATPEAFEAPNLPEPPVPPAPPEAAFAAPTVPSLDDLAAELNFQAPSIPMEPETALEPSFAPEVPPAPVVDVPTETAPEVFDFTPPAPAEPAPVEPVAATPPVEELHSVVPSAPAAEAPAPTVAVTPFTGELPSLATPAERQAVNRTVLESLSAIASGIDQVQSELNGLYESLAQAASNRASVNEIVSLTERLTTVKAEVGENSALYQQALQLRAVAEAYLQLLRNL